MEIQGRGRCPSAVDYDGADWRFSFDTHPLTAALAITDELSNTDITRILRRLAATLGVFNAKTPSFNAMRAVLSQLSSPHTHLTNEDVCLAWNAKPSNFGTWKKDILALHATIPLAPPPTFTHPPAALPSQRFLCLSHSWLSLRFLFCHRLSHSWLSFSHSWMSLRFLL